MSPQYNRVLDAVQAALRGATVLTPSPRLSRDLIRRCDSAHRARGESVWPSPDILPFDAFVKRCWQEWLSAWPAARSAPVLLTREQEQAVWERIIREHEPDTPLQIAATGRAAAAAWDLAHAWRAPLTDSRFSTTADCEAFARWAAAFEAYCRRENRLDLARLPDFVAGRLHAPDRVVHAGFDELTPRQKTLFDALPRVEQATPARFRPEPVSVDFTDTAEEFEQAANHARNLLEGNPAARIGVIVPDLRNRRAQVERIFREVLHPGPFCGGPRAYHLSLGLPLSAQPVVAAALAILDTALPRIGADSASLVLRSTFVGGAGAESAARARADAAMRRNRPFEMSREDLCDEAKHCPILAGALRLSRDREGAVPSDFARAFSGMLAAFGWPGDRTPSSDEYQALKAWKRALSAFAALDAVLPEVSLAGAIARLRTLLGETDFQPEDEGAPVQIMGVLESAGLVFDHLWITGVTDEQFPEEARPNPFLPLAIQRERNMPRATPEREAAFAWTTLERLAASAPRAVLSWPRMEGDRELQPSPLLPRLGAEQSVAGLINPELRRWHTRAPMERLEDETAPSLARGTVQRGGAGVLKSVSACPFQAFARYRLNAKPLEDALFGVSPGDKGSSVHKALDLLWRGLRSQAALLALSDQQLAELVSRHVEAALSERPQSPFRALEQVRIERIILDYLQLERAREPFTVLLSEEDKTPEIAGLRLSLRIDRVDELADGRAVLIDYKTGRVDTKAWTGERPREPQLPLYAQAIGAPLAAIALANVRTGEVRFLGVQDGTALGEIGRMEIDCGTLAEQRRQWAEIVERLATEFREGAARVDPLPKACDFCGLKALCRVGEEAAHDGADDAG